MKVGKGNIVVNDKPVDEYFSRVTARMILRQPLELTNNLASFDIMVNVIGGGESGQAGAVRHGITRALIDFDANLKSALSQAGFVTRDAREVERKKLVSAKRVVVNNSLNANALSTISGWILKRSLTRPFYFDVRISNDLSVRW